MEKLNVSTLLKPKTFISIGLTLFLIIYAGKFVMKDAIPYYGFDEETFGRFWNDKWSLIGHISGGILALVIGPFQFSKSFRNQYMTTHRWMGRIYLTAILLGSLSATYLSWTTAIKVNFSWALALQVLAFVWITTATMAFLSVLRGRLDQHREWMIRSYVLTFAFVNFRWLVDLPIAKEWMSSFAERGPAMGWLSWTIPLLITEIILSWKKK